MRREEEAKRFNFRCPYRDIPCTTFYCEVCEIEEEERRWMEESEGESEVITEADKERSRIMAHGSCGRSSSEAFDHWIHSDEVVTLEEKESADAKWQKRIEAIKDDINQYWLYCDFAENDKHCKECGKNVFESVLRIIDKHTKGEPDGYN